MTIIAKIYQRLIPYSSTKYLPSVNFIVIHTILEERKLRMSLLTHPGLCNK